MKSLNSYQKQLAKKHNLPNVGCIFTPDVYWKKLDQSERNTLHNLREAERVAYSRMP